MSSDRSTAILDQARDGYRTGIRAWSRDLRLSALVLLLTGVFVVLPYLPAAEEQATVAGERAAVVARHQRVERALAGIGRVLAAIDEADAALAATGEDLAGRLSDRLREFAALVRELGAPPPVAGVETPGEAVPPAFPGWQMAQQMAPGAGAQFEQPPLSFADPADALSAGFGLDADAVAAFRDAFADGPGAAAWQAASALTMDVFKAEIEAAYAELQARVATRLEALRASLKTRLAEVAKVASELDIPLPAAAALAPAASVVRLPPEDELFRTVEGKVGALRDVALYEVRLDLDAAATPLRTAADLFSDAQARLGRQRAQLATRRAEIETRLVALEQRLDGLRAELGGLAGPLAWLDLDARSFVRLYPTLLAVAFVWLAHRRARLDVLGARLASDYRAQGLAGRDIALALYVPEATFGGLGGHGGRLRAIWPLAAAGLVIAALVGLIVLIETNPGAAMGWVRHAPALVLALVGCFYAVGAARGAPA